MYCLYIISVELISDSHVKMKSQYHLKPCSRSQVLGKRDVGEKKRFFLKVFLSKNCTEFSAQMKDIYRELLKNDNARRLNT